jgi:parallel beta-helix repeat protein
LLLFGKALYQDYHSLAQLSNILFQFRSRFLPTIKGELIMNTIIPADGMVITESVRLEPGIYVLPNGISIGMDHVTVEAKDVLILSPTQTGVGIQASGRRGLTIRGLRISGFYHGIRLDNCEDVLVEGVQVRGTQEIEGIDTFLYLWLPIEKAYGGAILLHNVTGGAVRDCDLQHQMNGILMYHTSGVTVERCNASFNSGWGIYLSDSHENTVQDNQLDFCNRVYRRPENGSIRVEADAAGIVLVKALRATAFCVIAVCAVGTAFLSPDTNTPAQSRPATTTCSRRTTAA